VTKKTGEGWNELRHWRTLGWLFVETRIFTAAVTRLLDEEAYRALQLELAVRPEAGDVIPGSGGVRKVRWGRSGRGKRGGVRVFYLHRAAHGRIHLLHVIDKAERADLTRRQVAMLRAAVEEELQ
jgi:hypothetical protein